MKKANIYLNAFELISFIIAFCTMGLYLQFNSQLFYIVNNLLFLVTSVFGLLFIAIELFLFLIMNNRTRFVYITYMLIDLLLGVYLNLKYPFIGFIIFIIFAMGKNTLRVIFVKDIYNAKEFNYYCKMFGIKIKDFNKKKVTVKVKKEDIIEIPEDEIKETKEKTSKSPKTVPKKA